MDMIDNIQTINHVAGGPEPKFPWCAQLPMLNAAVDEVEHNIKAPRALIFTGALTAIAVAVQGLVDVAKPSGQTVPTSVMLLAIANSGARKSTVENMFLKPIRDIQR